MKNKIDLAFDSLVNTMEKYDLYQKDDEVGLEIANMRRVLDEVRTRLVIVGECSASIIKVITEYQDAVDAGNPFTMVVNDFDTIQNGSRDVLTLLDFENSTPVDENWSTLFQTQQGKYSYHSYDGSNLSVIRLTEEEDLDDNTFNTIEELILSLPELDFILHEDLVNEKLLAFYGQLEGEEEYFEHDIMSGTCHVLCSGSYLQFNCTPFWSDNDNIDIEIFNLRDLGDGKLVYNYQVPCAFPKTLDDIEAFKTTYRNLVRDLVSKL